MNHHSFTIQEMSLIQLKEAWNRLKKRFTESAQENAFSSCPCSPAPLLLQASYLRIMLYDKEKTHKYFSPPHSFEQFITFKCMKSDTVKMIA